MFAVAEDTERVLMEAKGANGRLELLEDRVRIRRKGLGSKGLGGDREFPIRQLDSVQFKDRGLASGGYIRFVLGGQAPGPELGLLKAGGDVNSVVFGPFQKKRFEAIRQAIQQRIDERNAPAEVPPSASSAEAREGKRSGPEVAGGVEILDDRARKMLERNLSPGEEPEFVLVGQRMRAHGRTNAALVALPDRALLLMYGINTPGTLIPGGEFVRSYSYRDGGTFELQKGGLLASIRVQPLGIDLLLGPEISIDKGRAEEYQPYINRLNEKVRAARQHGAQRPPEESSGGEDLVAKLARLADLRDSGTLTEEEFQKAKSRLLR